jgi:NAD-dependent dihydropyrimidine dehydrogenase PreA subunit
MFGLRHLSGVTTLRLEAERCTGCKMCLDVCPHAVLELEAGKVRIADRDACMECGACARNCPAGALAVKAGVGCAAAVINAALRGGPPTCDCGGQPGTPCC